MDEFSPCVLPPLMIGLIVVLLTFFWMVSMVLLLLGVHAILGNEYGIKDKIMLHCLREVKCYRFLLQGFDMRYVMF